MPGTEDFGKRTSVPCTRREVSYIESVKLPLEVPVMTLPNATLLPQAWLPLYIFEPRYRQMLSAALQGNRMLCVAMRRPGSARETPLPMAGLGVIRVAVRHDDGTSHLILQGVARVQLGRVVRYRPYRLQSFRSLSTPPCDSVAADALLAKVRELLQVRFELGLPFPFSFLSPTTSDVESQPSPFSAKEVLGYLDSISQPEKAADLVSCAVLKGARERQAILEAVDVETRLRRLIEFLLRDIRNHRKG
jgi:ATP-dependent Lon protease